MLNNDDVFIFIGNGAMDHIYKPRAVQIKEELAKFDLYHLLDRKLKQKYDDLVEELDRIQKSCSHDLRPIVLFQLTRYICNRCDWEDRSYNPVDPNKRKK